MLSFPVINSGVEEAELWHSLNATLDFIRNWYTLMHDLYTYKKLS